ncbi:MAG: zinc ribbon domain-containing protein [Proteobacteria bacterium]|nr:MAG: zinc ribbon domain-containing protein [Pseudomonadota bacterium]
MALIKCAECGNEVSTTAKACPKCGAKVIDANKAKNGAVGCAAIIVIFFFLILLGKTCSGSDAPA